MVLLGSLLVLLAMLSFPLDMDSTFIAKDKFECYITKYSNEVDKLACKLAKNTNKVLFPYL